MAKVYDALKQVEAERSRQLRSETEASRWEARPEPNRWKRFSSGIAGCHGAADSLSSEVAAEVPANESVATILGRLDDGERLASMHLAELERQMRQEIESRVDEAAREHATSMAILSNQVRRDLAVLRRRVALLCGAVLILLAAVVWPA